MASWCQGRGYPEHGVLRQLDEDAGKASKRAQQSTMHPDPSLHSACLRYPGPRGGYTVLRSSAIQ